MSLDRVLLAGCGNMAGAMLTGWLAGGFEAGRFGVHDPAGPSLPEGVTQHPALPMPGQYDAIMLGFKPQALAVAAPALAPLAGSGTFVFSLLAGANLSSLRSYFPDAGAIVRVMPNLAVALGKAPIVMAVQAADAGIRAEIDHFMRPLGTPEWVDELLMDAATALVGSGPAFVYRFIDALASAGEAIGLPADQAQRLALQMVEGASALAAASEHAPGALARRVASPGGTTEAGLAVLDEEQALSRLVAACLAAARDRGGELARDTALPR